jgi:hypothetical protein
MCLSSPYIKTQFVAGNVDGFLEYFTSHGRNQHRQGLGKEARVDKS